MVRSQAFKAECDFIDGAQLLDATPSSEICLISPARTHQTTQNQIFRANVHCHPTFRGYEKRQAYVCDGDCATVRSQAFKAECDFIDGAQLLNATPSSEICLISPKHHHQYTHGDIQQQRKRRRTSEFHGTLAYSYGLRVLRIPEYRLCLVRWEAARHRALRGGHTEPPKIGNRRYFCLIIAFVHAP